jgi:hypothetical protein
MEQVGSQEISGDQIDPNITKVMTQMRPSSGGDIRP